MIRNKHTQRETQHHRARARHKHPRNRMLERADRQPRFLRRHARKRRLRKRRALQPLPPLRQILPQHAADDHRADRRADRAPNAAHHAAHAQHDGRLVLLRVRLQDGDGVLEDRARAEREDDLQPDEPGDVARASDARAGEGQARVAEPHHGPVGDLLLAGGPAQGPAPGHDEAGEGHPDAVREHPGQHVGGGAQGVHAVGDLEVGGDEVEEGPVDGAHEELLEQDDGDGGVAEDAEGDHGPDAAVFEAEGEEGEGGDAAQGEQGDDARVVDGPLAAGLGGDDEAADDGGAEGDDSWVVDGFEDCQELLSCGRWDGRRAPEVG